MDVAYRLCLEVDIYEYKEGRIQRPLAASRSNAQVNAIRAVAAGDIYIHPAMTHSLLNTQRDSREIEVLKLIVQEHTNRQIAEILHLSVRTFESHRANIMDKLDLRSWVVLVRYTVGHGLLDLRKNYGGCIRTFYLVLC